MSEKKLNKVLLEALHKKHLDPQRIENTCAAGTPDIEFVGGWIESKYLPSWPKRLFTPVRVPHFTSAQRSWHTHRWICGGQSWIALQVGAHELLIFRGHEAAANLGFKFRSTLYHMSVMKLLPFNKAQCLPLIGQFFEQFKR